MLDDAHATAFTVAKTAGMDVVGDIYAAVVKAAESGQTLEQFSEQLTPVLQAKGWWGRQDVPHPDTGEIQTVRLGSPHRLKTIYLTNMQSAYMAGRYAEMMDAVDTHPYWEYVAVNDERTRETHRLLHGSVYAADDPVWDSLYPPLDYRCCCRVRPLLRSRRADRVKPSPKLETQTVDIGVNQYTGEERHARRTGMPISLMRRLVLRFLRLLFLEGCVLGAGSVVWESAPSGLCSGLLSETPPTPFSDGLPPSCAVSDWGGYGGGNSAFSDRLFGIFSIIHTHSVKIRNLNHFIIIYLLSSIRGRVVGISDGLTLFLPWVKSVTMTAFLFFDFTWKLCFQP